MLKNHFLNYYFLQFYFRVLCQLSHNFITMITNHLQVFQFFKLFNIQIIMKKRLIVLTFSLILLSLSILLFHLQKDLIIICFVIIITLIRILILRFYHLLVWRYLIPFILIPHFFFFLILELNLKHV